MRTFSRSRCGYWPSMDALTLLRSDHKTVESLFKRFEKAGDKAYVAKREIVDRIIEELSVHAAIEEQVFYPTARSRVPKTENIALESLEEHHILKWVLSELEGLDPRDERFDAKVTVLIENVRHHVEEEQTEFFPLVRNAMGRAELEELGKALASAKKTAPTHPHPRSPDSPPANSPISAIAGVVDRVGDNLSGIAQGGVAVARDVVARLTGSTKPTPSATGSSVARGTAKATRSTVESAGRAVASTAKSVKTGVDSTTSALSNGARDTLTTSKKAAEKTATAAKRATATTGRTAKKSAQNTLSATKAGMSRTVAASKR